MIILLLSVSLVLNAITLYLVFYDLPRRMIDKDDFIEYAKITKQKFDEMYSDIKGLREDVVKAKISADDTYKMLLDERIERENVLKQIEEITTQLQAVSKRIDELIEDRAKLKASLVYSKKRIKELKKELKKCM